MLRPMAVLLPFEDLRRLLLRRRLLLPMQWY
jgi:hypothetical protein